MRAESQTPGIEEDKGLGVRLDRPESSETFGRVGRSASSTLVHRLAACCARKQKPRSRRGFADQEASNRLLGDAAAA